MSAISEHVDEVLKDFKLTNDELLKVSERLREQFERGLDNNANATVKMLPTFVRDIPSGKENGTFISLDIGRSSFEISHVEIRGILCDRREITTYDMPKFIMNGSGEDLFDYIAKCLEQQIKGPIFHRIVNFGLIFSFPCIHKDLLSAVLVKWTKEFKFSGVVGMEVDELFRSAMSRRNQRAYVVAVMNDTTAVLMSCAFKNKNCRIGLVIDNGCNACYMEKVENVKSWTGDQGEAEKVVINTEWGAFGDNGCLQFIRTDIDRKVDENSSDEGKQIFEKMTSGMYMGEIVRRIVMKLGGEGVIFKGNLSREFCTPFKFTSKYLSLVEGDSQESVEETTRILQKKMGVNDVSREDCEILKRVCSCVSTRSAHLVSAGVGALLNKLQRRYTIVGVDGCVYRDHPFFKNLMEDKIEELTDPNYRFELMLSEEGISIGAGIVTALAVKEHIRKQRARLHSRRNIGHMMML